jgi:hypothetical protein
MMRNIVSVLLPTRKRFDLMLKSVKSLYDKATFPEKIELLLWFDDDDLESISRIKEVEKITLNYQLLIGPRNKGYASLHEFINSLCKVSTGNYLLLWNDDALMMNSGWDEELTLYDGETICIQMDNNSFPYIFPIISRDIYEVLGHFSLSPYNDTWIHDVCSPCGIEICDTDIYAIHDRPTDTGNNDDETFREGIEAMGYPTSDEFGRLSVEKIREAYENQPCSLRNTYYSDETQRLVEKDILKLKKYLKEKRMQIN